MISKYNLNRRQFLKKTGILGALVFLSKPLRLFSNTAANKTGMNFKILDFGHVTDIHITDGTNPLRVEFLDSISFFSDAYRPQQHMSAAAWNAVVRSINEQNSKEPLEFVISTGDQVDNAVQNEFQWLLDVANGDDMSGNYDDLVSQGKMTPVDPVGIDAPWYAALGNHDTMMAGNFPARLMEYIFRNMEEQYGFEIMTQSEVMEMLNEYGFDKMPEEKDGYYSFDSNEYVHCIVLNTNNDNWIEGLVDQFFMEQKILIGSIILVNKALGGKYILNELFKAFLKWVEDQTHQVIGGLAWGTLDRVQEKWLKDEIEKNSDKLCLVFSHHGPESFLTPPGNVTPEEFKTILRSYENVIAHIFGHSHHNIILKEESGYGNYWSINTCSVIEYPQEWRRVSIWDNGDGTGIISCRMFQHDFSDSINVSYNDPQSEKETHYGRSEDRDVDLEFIIPALVGQTIINNKPLENENPPSPSGEESSDETISKDNLSSDPEEDNKSSGNGEMQCFIATAAYGTVFEPEVEALRNFRDSVLEKTFSGRKLIKIYYYCSPPIAGFISGRPAIKFLIRKFLDRIIFLIKKRWDI